MRRAAALLALALVIPATAQAAEPTLGKAQCATDTRPGGEWPLYGHDLSNTRNQDAEKTIDTKVAPTLGPVWTFGTVQGGGAGDIPGTPIVAGGCVYVGSSAGFIFALNPDTGKIVWRQQLKGAIQNSLGYGDGRVYAGVINTTAQSCADPRCDGPYEIAFDAKSGKELWRSHGPIDTQADADIYGSPVFYDPTPGDQEVLAAAGRCRTKKLRLHLKAPRGMALNTARVYLNGRRVKATRRGRVFGVKVDPGRLAKGVARLRVAGRTRSGRALGRTRRWYRCRKAGSQRRDRRARQSTVPADDAIIIQGVSGWAAEGNHSLADSEARDAFEGSVVFLDAATGKVIKKTWTIHPPASQCTSSTCEQKPNENAGATVWTTAAVDTAEQVAYMGTGNPYDPNHEDPRSNAVLKFDVNPSSQRFGEIIASGKGNVDQYAPADPGNACVNPPTVLDACGDQDLDFGASPNLFTDSKGRKLVGEGQKSGVYHAFDTKTMQHVWQTPLGPPTLVGGIVGSTAWDGKNIYGPITTGGYIWSVTGDEGTPRWTAPLNDAAHYGNPTAVANGVVYTTNTGGFLDALDAASGASLLHASLSSNTQTGSDTVMTYGGASIARGTVYAATGMQGNANGFVIAFRPGGKGSPAPDTLPKPAEPAEPAGSNSIFALPGAQSAGFANPDASITKGDGLSFRNLDTAAHNVTAVKLGSGGSPLFRSANVPQGANDPIRGVSKLPAGGFDFYCTIHPNMRGKLTVR